MVVDHAAAEHRDTAAFSTQAATGPRRRKGLFAKKATETADAPKGKEQKAPVAKVCCLSVAVYGVSCGCLPTVSVLGRTA